jgi:hypothetical protein
VLRPEIRFIKAAKAKASQIETIAQKQRRRLEDLVTEAHREYLAKAKLFNQ